MNFKAIVEKTTEEYTIVSVFEDDKLCGYLNISTRLVPLFMELISGRNTISQKFDTIESGASVIGVKIGRLG